VIKVGILTMILFSLPMPLTWIERKVAGHIHARLGPFRVGPHGVLQPVADTIKLFLKEDIVPEKADKFIFKLAPLMAMVPAFAVFVAIPLGDTWTIPVLGWEMNLYVTDMNVGLLYILAIGGLGIYGLIYGGWASNSKYALLGGLRSAAQMISYELGLSFAAVGVVMMSNSLSLVEIVRSQGGGLWNWNFFYLPVGPVWFFIFIIAGTAEINRIPFVPDAFIWVFWFVAKTAVFIYVFMWVRFTLPRYRYDQLMNIGWKVLIPVSLVNILVTGFMRI